MRGNLLIFFLTWLLSLSSYASGDDKIPGDNRVAHVFERIWLWEMYEFFCDADTASAQQKLFPHYNEDGDPLDRNIGRKGDKRLDYARFQKRLQEGGHSRASPPPTIDSPANGDPFKSAKQLLDLGWSNIFDSKEVDPTLPYEKSFDPRNYPELIDKTEQHYSWLRLGFAKDPYGDIDNPDRIKRIADIAETIVIARKQDRFQYITDSVTVPRKNGGLGLEKVVTTKHQTALKYNGMPLGPAVYEKPDWKETYLANCIKGDKNRPGPKLKALGVGKYNELVDEFIKFGKATDEGSTKSDKSHRHVLANWSEVSAKAKMTIEELKGC
ncbi:hypothetical protein MGYG_08118 [Nannizzia gypsea CBS 118893]|uniref:Uncharacterized protein n=1 Tax=Arthroderma gypseum (strain ATCC MYA-4604 / CBS 118893) TaxID=535722 RepID=E4V535_ARTGP|nr:hypothetical protein MGYG_08118 [Nannizzia gypsea CBS 118893]EFR05109.1 hypothetical protein MGYG_08118 [Nannizzia gypsea CBS 118893]